MGKRKLLAVLRSASLQLELAEHAHLVRLLGIAWSVEAASVVLVMELMDDTLGAALRGPPRRILDWKSQKLPIARGVASGLNFLHSQRPPIIHRDLKPENILLDVACSAAKIGDFDTLRNEALSSTSMMSCDVGTPCFTAPEVQRVATGEVSAFDEASKYDATMDIWSFGCVLACLQLDRTFPYLEIDPHDVYNLVTRVTNEKLAPSVPADSTLHALVATCCLHEASARPSADDVGRQLDALLEAASLPQTAVAQPQE